MSTEDILIEEVSWNLHRETLRSIRGKVFIEEQNVPQEIERDDHDETATHFLLTRKTVALGCGRLLADGKIGRMAILTDQRGQGLGLQLLHKILQHARRNGMQRLYLYAQTHALEFYRRAGFEAYDEPFEEAGLPHRAMELLLDYSGVGEFVTGVGYPEPFATLACELASSAHRQLRIYSPQLDKDVFDSPQMESAISAMARESRYSEIRILISDCKPMVKQGHRLLSLSRRLSSAISIHVLAEHPELPNNSFVIRDNNGILYKPNDSDRVGFYEPDSPSSAQRFIDLFDALWNRSKPDPELRQLGL
jgi:predicted GNAT family N-acyltransferase